MGKFFTFVREHKFIAVALTIAITITIGLVVITHQTKKGSSTPTPTKLGGGPSFKSIIPGISTEDEANEQLGGAKAQKQEGSKKILEYKSTSPIRQHQLTVEETRVVFVKEIVSANDNKKAQDLKQEYGEPPYTLFNQSSYNSSFSLFVYPEKGFAYLGHEDGTLLEIWYFPPTIIDELLKQWSQNYSFEMPPQAE